MKTKYWTPYIYAYEKNKLMYGSFKYDAIEDILKWEDEFVQKIGEESVWEPMTHEKFMDDWKPKQHKPTQPKPKKEIVTIVVRRRIDW